MKLKEIFLFILDFFTWVLYIIELPEPGEPGIIRLICDCENTNLKSINIPLEKYKNLKPQDFFCDCTNK